MVAKIQEIAIKTVTGLRVMRRGEMILEPLILYESYLSIILYDDL
jgi:hypothetical protein